MHRFQQSSLHQCRKISYKGKLMIDYKVQIRTSWKVKLLVDSTTELIHKCRHVYFDELHHGSDKLNIKMADVL